MFAFASIPLVVAAAVLRAETPVQAGRFAARMATLCWTSLREVTPSEP